MSITAYPLPSLPPAIRAAVDEEAWRIAGQDFESLVLRCKASAWRPHSTHGCLRALVEVALASAPASVPAPESAEELEPVPGPQALAAAAAIVSDLEGRSGGDGFWGRIDQEIQAEIVQTWATIIEASCSPAGELEPDDDLEPLTTAEQIVELLDDATYLQEEDRWVCADGSVLDIGEGYVNALGGSSPVAPPTADE